MKNEGTAVASMVLGIVGIVLCFIPFLTWGGLVCAIVGLILGVTAKNKIKANNDIGGMGMATTGIVLSIITIGLFLLVMIACASFFNNLTSFM